MATSRYTQADRAGGRQMASPRAKTRDTKDTLCRNVLIYGHCRYEDQGCAFNHDQNKGNSNSMDNSKKSLNVDSPSFTPAQLQAGASQKKFTFSSQAANAAPFTPKAVPAGAAAVFSQDSDGALFNPAVIKEFTPQTQNYDLNTATGATNGVSAETGGSVYDPFSTMSTIGQTMPTATFNPYAEDQNPLAAAAAGSTFYQSQGGYTAPMQPLQFHLYAPIGPYKLDLTPYQRQPHDFFLREDIREDLHKKSEAARQVLPNSQLPNVGIYHSLVPLDTVRAGSITFGNYLTWVYKATSKKNGHIYCLRRLQGLALSNPDAVRVINSWKRVTNGNIVSILECFTSRAFNDTSLIFIHNYHPLSKTLAEQHFTAQNGRYNRPAAVPESVLWSYVCQITSALKAIHGEKLAARSIEASKIILTNKNRIRLSACGILDVLEHESPRPIHDLQHDDLTHLGRLILAIGTSTPALCNPQATITQAAVDQFGRTYSAELRDRVVWLLTPALSMDRKDVHELALGVSSHILDSFDSALHAEDEMVSNLHKELENGRIARLVMKLGAINERPEYDNDINWSENGERYPLKLFRDYVFHQVDSNGNAVVDLGHMISCLNKLDAGVDEKVYLVSRDHQSGFLVSYKELRKQVANSFGELLKPSHGKQVAPRGY